MSRKKILFVVENVTLAQVVRLLVLARGLDPARYEVHFACSRFDDLLFDNVDVIRHELYTVGGPHVEKALKDGKRLYEVKTLKRYVADELALLEKVRPDLVVGDFRLSLGISAPAFGVPLATLINAYWSPYAVRPNGFPVPDHPIVKLLGLEMAAKYFPKAIPKVFAHFAAPINSVRKKYGLAPIGSLLEVLTYGDHVLYPDVPGITPTEQLPTNHHYLGPVIWSPEVTLPDWWSELEPNRPTIYVTLGSSGDTSVLPQVMQVLGDVPATVLLTSAGRDLPGPIPPNTRVAPFLPGHLAARRSALVVCNGGSTTGYQALQEGVPVVGVASNFDQYLATQAIEAVGAGALVRAGLISVESVRGAVTSVFGSVSHFEAAKRVQAEFAQYDCHARFGAFLEAALAKPQAAE